MIKLSLVFLIPLIGLCQPSFWTPPKLTDPLAKPSCGNRSICFFLPSPVEEWINSMIKDAARCVLSKHTTKGLGGEDISWTDNTIDINYFGSYVVLSACGNLTLSPGLTMEQALRLTLQAIRDEQERNSREESRKQKILKEHFDADEKLFNDLERILNPGPKPPERNKI